MTSPTQTEDWAPRAANTLAWAVFVGVALSLTWPIFAGQFLAGDDQLIAGYAFRDFGAQFFRDNGRIPEWNPYLFGGMPFIAAMHGDIFYPTAWLRWLLPTDFAMGLGFLLHLVIAGGAMYALLRAFKLSWTAALAGGVAYELSGIVASMMRPGHDGKLFVAALAPLAFLALLKAIRHGRIGGYGAFAVIIGLAMLSPHFQTTYYLLVASGLWALWLALLDPERERLRTPVKDLGSALGGVVLGIGIGMIQGLPFLKYIPFSPRVEGGDSSGWEYATSFAMPLDELASTFLPQFNGMFQNYWGSNFFKTHVEYLGALVIILAILGFSAARKRGLGLGLGVIGGLFLLVAFGGHTPFYRIWYSVMPMMDKVRAAGMAFYLPTMVVVIWSAFGIDRLIRGEVTRKQLAWPLGVMLAIALLALSGGLQPVAEALSRPETLPRAIANADALQGGGARMMFFLLLGGAALFSIASGKLRTAGAAFGLVAILALDGWTVLREYTQFVPSAPVTFADDELMTRMKATTPPFRNFDPRSDAIPEYNGLGLYQGSWLMAEKIPTVFGYHGNEIRYYDELWGTKNIWQNQISPSLWDLWAVQFMTLSIDPGDQLAGYSTVLGPTPPTPNAQRGRAPVGFLAERDTPAEWVRVVPAAVKVAEDQLVATLIDSRFPTNLFVLVPDSSLLPGATSSIEAPDPTAVEAELTSWAPGEMTVALTGSDPRTTYLLIAENWFPGWLATIDGEPAPTWRSNHSMLTVAIPSGASEVTLSFSTPGYDTGKLITALSLLVSLALIGAGRLGRGEENG